MLWEEVGEEEEEKSAKLDPQPTACWSTTGAAGCSHDSGLCSLRSESCGQHISPDSGARVRVRETIGQMRPVRREAVIGLAFVSQCIGDSQKREAFLKHEFVKRKGM